MATKNTTTATEAAKPTTQQVVNDGIVRVIQAHNIDAQKNRYKAMRAIAWQAFAQAVEAGTFDLLVSATIKNVEKLPAGWEIAPPSKSVSKPSPAKSTTPRSGAAR